MKKYLLLLTLSLSLFGQNPQSFAALGDVIYNDIDKFEKLKEMPTMQEFRTAIDSYITSAKETKKMGFAIDAKDTSVNGKLYLNALRKLSTEHDAIIGNSRTRFKEAIEDEDGETIIGMVNYGVINTDNYQDELIHYYEEFNEDQNLSSLKGMYTKYISSLKKDDNSTAVTAAQKEILENKASIERMRAKDKAKSDALESSVKEEKDREKKKVLNEQKRELGIE
ncbi:MAG: hypothetical protein PF439_00775 [Helicobacteraceae bacterium]|jgi:hypothetical protein|nr:hypothetical protein [Helicobacteraceae bacterium]